MKFFNIIPVLVFLASFQTYANLITIESSDTTGVGNNITVNLLADFSESVDTFNFDFLFDTGIFALVEGRVQTDLPDDGFNNFFEIAANAGGVGISFLSFTDFITGEFLLASFELNPLKAGRSEFSVISNEFFNSVTFESYALMDSSPASVQVSAPATQGLFALAVMALLCSRKIANTAAPGMGN